MEVSGQLHAPDALYQGMSPQYPLDRRLGRNKGFHSFLGNLAVNPSMQRALFHTQ